MHSGLEKEIEAEDFVKMSRDRCLDKPTRCITISILVTDRCPLRLDGASRRRGDDPRFAWILRSNTKPHMVREHRSSWPKPPDLLLLVVRGWTELGRRHKRRYLAAQCRHLGSAGRLSCRLSSA